MNWAIVAAAFLILALATGCGGATLSSDDIGAGATMQAPPAGQEERGPAPNGAACWSDGEAFTRVEGLGGASAQVTELRINDALAVCAIPRSEVDPYRIKRGLQRHGGWPNVLCPNKTGLALFGFLTPAGNCVGAHDQNHLYWVLTDAEWYR